MRHEPPSGGSAQTKSGRTDWTGIAGSYQITFPHGLDATPKAFIVTVQADTTAPSARGFATVATLTSTTVTVGVIFPDYDFAPPGTQFRLHWIAVMP